MPWHSHQTHGVPSLRVGADSAAEPRIRIRIRRPFIEIRREDPSIHVVHRIRPLCAAKNGVRNVSEFYSHSFSIWVQAGVDNRKFPRSHGNLSEDFFGVSELEIDVRGLTAQRNPVLGFVNVGP